MFYEPHHILNLILPGTKLEPSSQKHPVVEKLQSQPKPDLAVIIICKFSSICFTDSGLSCKCKTYLKIF